MSVVGVVGVGVSGSVTPAAVDVVAGPGAAR